MKYISIVLVILFIVGIFYFTMTPGGVASVNNWFHSVQKADDITNYETRKTVEDTCRATIVSYESDRLMWEQYKDSEDAEQRGWADAAKIRANKAALTYNEYFLKNSYVFNGNIPTDIWRELQIIE